MIYEGGSGQITLMLGGDVMLGRSLSGFREPNYLSLVDKIRSADLAFANLETTVRARDEGNPTISPGTYMTTNPRLLDDLKWFGVKMVSCANNHAFDFGEGGVSATCRHLDEAGIAHAGSGDNLTLARRPAYVDTPKGRVGLISVTATFLPWTRAGEPRPDTAGRAGINPLRAQLSYTVPPAELAVLRKLSGDLGFAKENARNRQHFFSEKEAPSDSSGEVHFLGARFVAGDKPSIASIADLSDIADNLRWIREARRQCDWLIVSLHSHEYGFASVANADKRSDMTEPADFCVEFARAAIDAGADVIAGHGSHTPLATEIYNGKPIFYGLGNLVFHNDTVEILPSEAYDRFDLSQNATPADFQDTRTANDTKGHPGDRAFWETILAECRFTEGKLDRIIVHPCDLGYKLQRSQRGRPVMATGEVAERVLSRVETLSGRRGALFKRSGETTIYQA